VYALELRTYGLGAVVTVFLGAGISVGWHYFADSAGAPAVASAVAPPAQRDAASSPISCPPGPQEAPTPDVAWVPVLSRPDNQPDTTHATGTLKATHAVHASRARQVPAPARPDGGERPSDRGLVP
jgi:hypothetical protein